MPSLPLTGSDGSCDKLLTRDSQKFHKSFRLNLNQPDCSANQPVTGPRQSTINQTQKKKVVVVLQEEIINQISPYSTNVCISTHQRGMHFMWGVVFTACVVFLFFSYKQARRSHKREFFMITRWLIEDVCPKPETTGILQGMLGQIQMHTSWRIGACTLR